MAIYMKAGGITGDVTASGHSNWIQVGSVNFGIGRGVSSITGSTADRESTAPSVSEITLTKDQDVASAKLLKEALTGSGGGDLASVQLDFCRTNQGQLTVYQSITLSNVIISGYSMSSGGDRPSESISLNFTKIQVTFTQMEADGTAGQPATVTYDMGQAQTS